jgi:hypothetical protein
MSAFNTDKKFHGTVTEYDTDLAATVLYSTRDPLNCEGYTKLMVYYVCTTGWDRAGTITVYGALRRDDTYVAPDATIENGAFGVLHTDDAGEWYVVENIPNFIKLDWTNSTAGTTGTMSIIVMPFNS